VSGKRPYGRSRRDLAESAVRAFERDGFAATTVEEIAAEAGYSPRTFYRQFATKEDVVFFDLPDILSPLEALRGGDDPLWPQVCAVLEDNCALWEAGGEQLARRRTVLFHTEPALYRRFLEYCMEWEGVLTEVFAREHDATAAALLATTTVGACRTAFRLWLAQPDSSLVGHMRATLELVERGIIRNVSQ
jgi:AcrR family transcriptional regulator